MSSFFKNTDCAVIANVLNIHLAKSNCKKGENRLLVNISVDVYFTVQLPNGFFSVLASIRNLCFGTFVKKWIQKWGL